MFFLFACVTSVTWCSFSSFLARIFFHPLHILWVVIKLKLDHIWQIYISMHTGKPDISLEPTRTCLQPCHFMEFPLFSQDTNLSYDTSDWFWHTDHEREAMSIHILNITKAFFSPLFSRLKIYINRSVKVFFPFLWFVFSLPGMWAPHLESK